MRFRNQAIPPLLSHTDGRFLLFSHFPFISIIFMSKFLPNLPNQSALKFEPRKAKVREWELQMGYLALPPSLRKNTFYRYIVIIFSLGCALGATWGAKR